MTKRIFATVLALILCFTTFAIPTFAASAGSTTLTQTDGTNDVVATWPSISGSATYEAKLYLGDTQVGRTQTVTSSDSPTYSCTWTVSAAGTYTVQIIGKTTGGMQQGSTLTSSCNVTTRVEVGKFVFTKTGTTVKVDWSNWTVPTGVTVTNYNVIYTITGKTAVTKNKIGNVTNFTIPEAISATEGVSVTVQYCTAASDNAGNVGTNTLNASGTGVTGGSAGNTGTGTGTGTMTLTGVTAVAGYAWFNNGILTWTATNPVQTSIPYSIVYYTSNSSVPQYTSAANASWTVPAGVTKATISGISGEICTVTFNTYGSTATGSVWAQNGVVYWNTVTGVSRYQVWINGSSYVGTVNNNYYPISSSTIYSVTIRYELNGVTYTIGTAYLNGISSGTSGTTGNTGNNTNYFTSNGLTVNKGASSSVVTWTSSQSTSFLVTYTNLTTNQSETRLVSGQSSIQVPFGYNDTWSISVANWPNQNAATTKSVTVYPTGSGSTSTGTTTNAVTTQGTNCVVYSTSTTAQVTWSSVYGATSYIVHYAVGNSANSTTTSGTSITLPIGHANAFEVVIVNASNQTIVARASVAQNTSTDSTTVPSGVKTEIKNLTLEPTSWETVVSWDKVDNASYYIVVYGLYGATAGEEVPIWGKTSYTIPFGKAKNFTVTVYAVYNTGKFGEIGHATYIAGSTADNDDLNVAEGYEYVTGFKGTQANKKIKLAWNAAEDCDKYTIYWKRSNSDKWLKAGTTTKCAVNISGLTNGTSYDFMIDANGNESSVLTISPSSSSTKTIITDDPEVEEETTKVPEIKSAEGGDGTITVKWTEVKGATQYKVFIASKNSSSYKSKATVTTNACKITGIDEGTYKVRVKALVNGDWTTLSDCDYATVTVK